MRKPEYLSPTSIALWSHDPTQFYLRYLSDNRFPKEPQTLPMAVGSAFDAKVKNYLYGALGLGNDQRFAWPNIFEAQVEKQWWDQGLVAAEHLLANYKRLGALDALMIQLGKVVGKPRFEMDVRGTIKGRESTLGGVVLNGKPDLFYVTEQGAHVILDWKVTGWCGSASPMQGYVRLREDGKLPAGHADARVEEHLGMLVNTKKGLEDYNVDWARQLSIYSWLCGEEVGARFVAQIHQVVCREGNTMPRVRVAEHNTFISKAFQELVFSEALAIWEAINSGHIFKHLSIEQSKERCALLDQRAALLSDPDWSVQASRR